MVPSVINAKFPSYSLEGFEINSIAEQYYRHWAMPILLILRQSQLVVFFYKGSQIDKANITLGPYFYTAHPKYLYIS